ncbi:MAG: tetratricopeptide repeat protein [Alphaproteobacteria bacterium]|nr:tetratricopeptide repeat protein [Alphaproteobacteria bacterium]MDP6818661.1 tetratricopeptide repeat protein [Alphaproteobacteria bacterium]
MAADFDAGLSAFLDGDYRRAREIWLVLAEAGDAQSQFGVGMMFEGGYGVPPDPEKASVWYRRAADQGMSEAQLSLGALYEHGRGVARDPGRAADLYLGAAEQGNAQAQYNLAALYLGGEGIAPNRELGIAWLRRSAAQRYGRAERRLKMMNVAVEASDPALPRDPPQAAPSSGVEVPSGVETPAGAEHLQILIEDNQFEVPLAALGESEPESAEPDVAAPSGAEFTILLATFDREDAALAAWDKIKSRYPELLRKLRPKVTALKLDGGETVMWRLEAAAVARESEAVALCEALRRGGEYCFPLRAGEAPEN